MHKQTWIVSSVSKKRFSEKLDKLMIDLYNHGYHNFKIQYTSGLFHHSALVIKN